MGNRCFAAAAGKINFMGEGDSVHGETSFPGLTLKRAPRSLRIAPLDRTHMISY